ncbi:hypothetical protein ACG02S_07900 [Roseateles sp. DC23W]|uniref:Uncharacterized protein n=1 Tax=Pelomonas dachongensis TaxID=3299029 RepID=A0ABW7EKX9_9BURK
MQPFDLPSFAASWWPVFMETVPGSGERITVAIIVREAESGRASVRAAIAPSVYSTLFGASAGKGMLAMATTTIVELQRQLDEGVPVEKLEPPFGGFAFGTEHDGVARDAAELFDVGLRMSSGLGVSGFGAAPARPSASSMAFDEWADNVRAELLTHMATLKFNPQEFRARVKVARKTLQFGFMRGGFVANFGLLRPGSAAADCRALKTKIFDLEAVRREQLLPVNRADVVLGCPGAKALTVHSQREVETFHASWDFLATEARARGVNLVRCESHVEAARHIAMQVA